MSQFADSQFPSLLGDAFRAFDPDVSTKHTESQNVLRIEQLLTTVVRGEYDALHEMVAEDVEMEIAGPADTPMIGHHRGRQAVVEAIRTNFSLLEEQHPTIESVIAQGDQVVLVGHEKGRVRATGRPYELKLVQIYTLRDGKIARIHQIMDSAAWMAAVS